MISTINNKPYFILTAVLIVFFFPFFIYGTNTLFPVVDNLDCYYVWNKIVSQAQYRWSSPNTGITEFMSGVPRFTLVNGYSLFFLLNILFPSFYAVLLHMILIHSVACFSMYAFSVKYLTNGKVMPAIIAAILFGFKIDIYAYSLSLSLLPLLIITFINFYNKQISFKDWALLVIYPFVSNLQSIGIFVILIWGLLTLCFLFRKKSIGISLFIPVFLLTGLYYLNNYPTINNLIFNSYFISHRQEFINISTPFSFWGNDTLDTNQKIIYLVRFVIKNMMYLFLFLVCYRMYKTKHKSFVLLTSLATLVFLHQLLNIIINTSLIEHLQAKVSFLKMYHFEKLLFATNFLHVSCLAVLLAYFLEHYHNKWLNLMILSGALFFVCFNKLHWRPLMGIQWQNEGRPFNGYYSADLFKKIQTQIGKPLNQYKVATFGIHPAAAQYSGMFTIDGYSNNYPLTYKNTFRALIKEDLKLIHAKYGFKRYDFETTGHRCYLTNTTVENPYITLGIPVDKTTPLNISQTVHWNFDALKQLGCKYIISSVLINTEPGISLQLIYQCENNFYTLYLYQIN